MAGIQGYSILGELYQSENSIIYRGENPIGLPVIVKMLPTEFPPPERIARFRREFQMTARLQGDGIIRALELKRHDNALAMVIEDFGGESLPRILKTHELDLGQWLDVAVQTARAVAHVHAQRVIHKDINPANIVWNVSTGVVKLIDFGISTELSRESQAVRNPNIIEGTLAYTSPEQTGRMNRSMDYRTDLYSLGATLFHLFTGELPFDVEDPMELVHCHIARVPRLVSEINPELPPVLARIVAKLLEKSADDRYQTAAALTADLDRCLQQWRSRGAIPDFQIAANDVSDRFQIPQKLYGREGEIKTLLDAFGRVASGAKEMMLVAGYSGIGKSALVQEVHKPIVEVRGYFISGKFDLLARNIPYASLIQAFKGLVQQLLTETAAELAIWRERIAEAVGINGRVITDVIGEVELIIGPQPVVAELGPAEAKNRFNLVFANFIRVFSGAAHPLTLFLDDLQWADLPSLQLVKQFMTDGETTHMFLIGAYRDNEVDESHSLMITIEEMGREAAEINTITLEPIPGRHVNQLIADTLKEDPYSVASLTGVCMEKTRGNPFFLSQFLIALYEGGAIDFDAQKSRWTWDMRRIEAMEITDNVVELMARKIGGLPEETQRMVQLAACVGNTFDLKTLAIVAEQPALKTGQDLWQALAEGLVIPLDDSYKFLESGLQDGMAADADVERVRYRFLHDRVQQAAYSLIPEADRQPLHGRVGQLLLDKLDDASREENLFAIIGHLNIGASLLDAPAERLKLARLNLVAGRKGIGSAAYEPALDFLKNGIDLLSEDAWAQYYDLALALHEEAALASFQCTRFDEMFAYAQQVLDHSVTVLDRVQTYQTLISAGVAQSDFLTAIDHALTILEELGETFPSAPTQADIDAGFAEAAAAIGDREVEDLYDLPDNDNAEKAAAIRILANLASPAYIARPMLFPLIVFRTVMVSCKYGNIGASGYGYSTYAIFVSGAVEDADQGYRLGQMGNRVIAKYGAQDFAARTYYIPFCFTKIWIAHAREAVEGHRRVYQMALETGDLEFAGWTLMKRMQQSFLIGRELSEADREAGRYINALSQLKQHPQMHYAMATRQAMQNLMGLGRDPLKLVGTAFDEDDMLPKHVEANEMYGLCNLYVTKIMLGYIFEDYRGCLAHAEALAPYAPAMIALLHVPAFFFYDALARLALYPEADEAERESFLAATDVAIGRFEHWSSNCRENFAHRLEILRGMRAAAIGDLKVARRHLKEGIRGAAENEFPHDEAIGHELTGKIWLDEDEPEIAGLFLTKARHRYQLWGAKAKALRLSVRYSKYLLRSDSSDRGTRATRVTTTTTSTTTSATGGGNLDLDTVLKASQAISQEIHFERLLEHMMRIVIENAGAQRGVLLVDRGEGLDVVAAAKAGKQPRLINEATSQGTDGDFSQGIVAYVARSQDHVVLSNATRTGAFTSDTYVLRQRPKSVLCSAIVNQGKVVGVIYLENNLTTEAFNEERLEVLDLLLGQMAISMVNAQLYESLEEKVRERTAQLEVRNRFIQETFGRYLSDEIVSNLLEHEGGLKLGGEARKTTIMMTDLRGFTAMSETLPPEKVVAVINNYLGVMTEVVMRYDGTIDEFIGDAILVIFGAPVIRPDDAERAVACALAMQLAMEEVNAMNVAQGLPAVEMGIGLNTGEVVVGNIGSQKRAKYGVVGSNVNLASRIESYTIGGQILIPESTLNEIRDIVEVRGELKVQPKGVREPMTIYAVGALGGRHNLRLPTKEIPMERLSEPAAVRYAVLAAGDAVQVTFDGELIALSEVGAEFRTEQAVAQLSNVVFQAVNVDGTWVDLELYAKVIGERDAGLELHFTSLSESGRGVLKRIPR